MNSTLRYSLSLGLLVTLLVILMHLLGWFDWLERLTLDLRFHSSRWRSEPMSDQIRHVDIDDGAIDSIGRWPWPRSTFALAIDEINRAGARTIALDLLFSDPDDSAAQPDVKTSQPDQIDDDHPSINDSIL
ncbi:MAG TPA: CHASE2 domain-containing protein, partial [Phycisphaerales bacterium]|nr:CHASE2 domain-containing protein [Phycisphaerales bacterium]